MEIKIDLKDLFAHGHELYLRNISVDCTIFGFHENELKILLLKPQVSDKWAWPGGFIEGVESMDDSAQRILKERTGLENIFLQQFHAFGNAQRATQKSNQRMLEKL